MLIIGDKIFLANYGAGTVEDIGVLEGISQSEEYIKIYLLFDKMNIFLPKKKLERDRYRNISEINNMIKNIERLYEMPDEIEKNWNIRYRKNKEILQGLDIENICITLRNLYYLRNNQILPQGEEKILERAEGLVASEASMVFDLNMRECIEKMRNKSILKEVNKL